MSVTRKQLADALKACARVMDPKMISTRHECDTALSDARVLSDEFEREVVRAKRHYKTLAQIDTQRLEIIRERWS